MAFMFERATKFRIDSPDEARELEDQFRDESDGVVESDLKYKTKKLKGEVVDSWWVVKITEKFEV